MAENKGEVLATDTASRVATASESDAGSSAYSAVREMGPFSGVLTPEPVQVMLAQASSA